MLFKSRSEILSENYAKYGKIYGQFIGDRPALVIADPELFRVMNIRDFHNFVDKSDLKKEGEVLCDKDLSNLHGNEWRKMRSIITPTFSSAKMRRMHPIVIECVQRLEDYLKERVSVKNTDIELKNVMSKLTMDVIASCAFGTRIDVYNESTKDEFLSHLSIITRMDWSVLARILVHKLSSKALKSNAFQFINPKTKQFFKSIVQSIIANRMSQNMRPNDYMQLMIDLMNETSAKKAMDENVEDFEFTEDDVASNTMVFALAGYGGVGSLMAYIFYSLATNEKCQQKLYEEVVKFGGDYSYETIGRMPYLEACIDETLRLYTLTLDFIRIPLEDYIIGDTGITVPKGIHVHFDMHSIHHSPEYYPDPERWDPERFMPENRERLTPYAFIPFALGPRNCVGMRFALMEVKTAVAHLVYKFRFYKTSQTVFPLKAMKFHWFLKTCEKYVGIESRIVSK